MAEDQSIRPALTKLSDKKISPPEINASNFGQFLPYYLGEFATGFLAQGKQNRIMRGCLAAIFSALSVIWILFIGLILWLQGFSYRGFHLSDSVLISAIGATTVTILSLVMEVTKGLFGRNPKPTKKPQ